jgi:CubicO group peptidase (beta-lactamase class C family)
MPTIQRIEQLIMKHMQQIRAPGLALAIVEDSEIRYLQGFGTNTSAEPEKKTTPTTLFYIGSLTKPLVATAVMRLVDLGRLDLDKSIATYLPFCIQERFTPITMRMLLSHTSGLPTVDISVAKKGAATLGAFVQETFTQLQPVAPPGKLHYYSNLGYIVAGYIAECITHTSFPEIMQQLVFEPLAMTRSTFHPAAFEASLALPHEINSEGALSARPLPGANPAGFPAGLALSTATDLAQFMKFLLREPTNTLLSEDAFTEMSRPQVELYTPMEYHYGLGLFVLNFKGEHCIMHMGSMMSYMGEFRCFPARKCAVVALSNFCSSPKRWRIVAEVCSELLALPKTFAAPRPIAAARSHWPLYEGQYRHAKYGSVMIKQHHNQLFFQRENRDIVELQAFKEHLYRSADGKDFVSFLPEEVGKVQYIIVNEVPFQRIPERIEPQTW